MGGLYEQSVGDAEAMDPQINGPVRVETWEDLGSVLAEDVRRPFDFGQPPAFRVRLLSLPTGLQVLILIVPHLVADLWSLAILEREFVELYQAFLPGGARAVLPRIGLDHVAFTVRERERLSGDHYAEALAFWKDKWSLYASSQLRHQDIERDRPIGGEHGAAITEVSMGDSEVARIREACRAMRLTPYVFFRMAICAALHLETGRTCVAVGGNFANRDYSTRHAVGWFNNRHLVWSEISSATTWLDLAHNTKRAMAESIRHQEVPLQAVWHALGRSWDTAQYGVTATIDYHASAPVGGRAVVEVDRHFVRRWAGGWSGVDLDIRVWDMGDLYRIVALYSPVNYRRATMDRLLRKIVVCAGALAARPAGAVVGSWSPGR